ncbi:DUF881 domain-containing protein [Gracilibacillus marinus]|uniref:DUF881 domain-containing protein n=1 Tax=Gracilibacillus marinus TaxID=630535 RepID=A0ABV8VS81_9BACI
MQKISRKALLSVSFICFLIGFMIAVLFEAESSQKTQDSRDLWEIRSAIAEQQQQQQHLYDEITIHEELLSNYEEKSEHIQIETLNDSIKLLEEQAGLIEKKGNGVIITFQPIFLEDQPYQIYPKINADLLHIVVNQLNQFGATDIVIDQERLINISPIRNVNDKVYVNNSPISDLPLEIKVLTNNVDSLINHMEVSEVIDYLAMENIKLTFEKASDLYLQPYEGTIDMSGIEISEQAEEDVN